MKIGSVSKSIISSASLLTLLFLFACGGGAATETSSQVAKTASQTAATSVPPTATSVPPTATPVPPTATSVPPTATPTPIPNLYEEFGFSITLNPEFNFGDTEVTTSGMLDTSEYGK